MNNCVHRGCSRSCLLGCTKIEIIEEIQRIFTLILLGLRGHIAIGRAQEVKEICTTLITSWGLLGRHGLLLGLDLLLLLLLGLIIRVAEIEIKIIIFLLVLSTSSLL